ncbi:MAG: TlpA disulfide reductase family protein [Bacteroidota bacterium]
MLVINADEKLEVPFNFEIKYKGKKPQIIIKNADERIFVDEITIRGDSVNFKMPVFDTEFRTALKGNQLEGVWINHYKTSDNIMKFRAEFNEGKRFLFVPGKPDPCFEGRWETTFSPGVKDSSKAIGVFHHLEQTDYLSGTFLTETGDYRYLEGMKHGSQIFLSSFDGKHAYLFVAALGADESLSGKFYSGTTWKEDWRARRNEGFKLNDPERITYLKNKDEKINFSFPNLDKKIVSLNDKKFENKAVIIQVMGSWCPNCMDESVYLSSVYRQFKDQGLEVVALAFEKTTDFEKARALLLRMKTRLKMEYDVLVTLQNGSVQASETFPALNKISAFPTTIFLNREHRVVKIYTGFSGPATGKDYETYKEQTEALIKNLLKD